MRTRISVIIAALNEREMIAGAIRSAWDAGAAEVLVADGGSTDPTASLAAQAGAVVIACPPGRAHQQNLAARSAHGDVLLFLHADARLPADGLRSITDHPDAVFGGFRQRISAPGVGFRLLEWGNYQRAKWLGLVYGDQAIFVARETFERVGGFPELPLMEDYVLSQTLRREAWPRMLPGPVTTSPRRWLRFGILRQTWRNWWIILRFHLGVSPERLAKSYRRHDQV
ncbi:MAG: TIGR04283 family arsenosugar biosynthesis glycosyltransferase [Pirellulaceae bacterium]